MWVRPIFTSCAASCSITFMHIYMKSSKSQDVGLVSDASISLSEFLHLSMNGKTSLWSSPTGHNLLFIEQQNLPHSVLLGLIFPCNIFITTSFSGWGSLSVFIKSQKSDNLHQNNHSQWSIPNLVINNNILSQWPACELFFHFLLQPHKDYSVHWISPTNW